MTDTAVTPARDIAIGERVFHLPGDFASLAAIQHAFGKDLLPLQASILDMRQDEIALLVAAASGEPRARSEIGQLILDELDVAGADYRMLKAELLAWLAIAMSPRRDREKKVLEMEKVIGGLRSLASPGGSTRNSASASSAGPRKRSGKAPSGT